MTKTKSKIRRRSGTAICNYMELLEWVPDIVVQVGIGLQSKEVDVMAESWPKTRFMGFEPHPSIVKSLKNGGYPGLIFECAIGDKQGKAILYAKNRHKDGSSLFPHSHHREGQKYPEIEVSVYTLDHVFYRELLGFDEVLLWIDCEGSELAVLRGGEKFLESVEVVNVEMTSKPRGEGWAKPFDVHEFLNDHGLFRTWTHTHRSCRGQYDAIYVRPKLFRSEYSCCPCQCEKAYGSITCEDR